MQLGATCVRPSIQVAACMDFAPCLALLEFWFRGSGIVLLSHALSLFKLL